MLSTAREARPVPIRFTIASRSLFYVSRQMHVIDTSLAESLSGSPPALPSLAADVDGYKIISYPQSGYDSLMTRHPGLVQGKLRHFHHHYVDMSGDFDNYLAQFSGKTRSTLLRKCRKFADYCGGTLDVREYSSPAEIRDFLSIARPLSARTFQERLLNAGLPNSEAELTSALQLAEADALRAYLLFHDDKPVSYLYLPVSDGTLIYSLVGYDPDYRQQSVGTVLQLEVFKRLFQEQRYRYFDFTSGGGEHKKLFCTDTLDCVSTLLLRNTAFNHSLLSAVRGFDTTVESLSSKLSSAGLKPAIRRLIRR